MSLRAEAIQKKSNLSPEGTARVVGKTAPPPEYIDDLARLRALMDEVVTSRLLGEQDRELVLGYPDHCRAIRDFHFRINNLLPDKITAPIWRRMVNGAIDGMIADLRIAKNNQGDWRPMEYEVSIETRGDERFLDCFCRLGDVMKSDPVLYQNGKPMMGVSVNTTLAPELTAALAKRDDPEIKELLARLVAVQEKQADTATAAPRATPKAAPKATDAAPPKRKPGRPPGWSKVKPVVAAEVTK